MFIIELYTYIHNINLIFQIDRERSLSHFQFIKILNGIARNLFKCVPQEIYFSFRNMNISGIYMDCCYSQDTHSVKYNLGALNNVWRINHPQTK